VTDRINQKLFLISKLYEKAEFKAYAAKKLQTLFFRKKSFTTKV